MENSVKNSHKFNILDLIIVVVLLAVLVGGWWFFRNTNSTPDGGETITYVIEINNVTEDLINSPTIGESVIDGVRKSKIGKIIKSEYIEQTIEAYNPQTDRIENVVKPGYYRLFITCEAQANISESAITVGNYRLAIGDRIFFQSKHFAGEGYCIIINTKGGQQ